jgi:hypothetical protein
MIEQPVGRFNTVTGKFVLTEDWFCELDGYIIHIYEGFASDGASIPKWAQSGVSPRYEAKTFPAALVHDALYATQYLSRKQADAEFYRLLTILGVSKFRALVYYGVVRAFGSSIWNKSTTEERYKARMLCWVFPKDYLVAL